MKHVIRRDGITYTVIGKDKTEVNEKLKRLGFPLLTPDRKAREDFNPRKEE